MESVGKSVVTRSRDARQFIPSIVRPTELSGRPDSSRGRTIEGTNCLASRGLVSTLLPTDSIPVLRADPRDYATSRRVSEESPRPETVLRKRDLAIKSSAAPSSSTASIFFVLTTEVDPVHRDRDTALLADSL